MKQISEYIDEKLKVSKQAVGNPSTDKEYVRDEVENAIGIASKNGLKLVFRDRKTPQGDFCFFLYDKSKKKSYIVGYDGYWSSSDDDPTSFSNCLSSVLEYIENYKK